MSMVFSIFRNVYACVGFIVVSHQLFVYGLDVSSRGTVGCKIPHSFVGESRDFSLSTGGGSREYRLHLPSKYNSNNATALIISYHGHGKNMVEQETLSQFSNEAINPDMIAVYPQGLRGGNRSERSWQGEFEPAHGVNDLLFTTDLINNLTANYCIDTSSIYANGMSDGGGFVDSLACSSEHGAAFAAFAPVSGAFYNDTKFSGCTPSRSPLPILEFHGFNDSTVNYTGGNGNGGPLPPIPDWLSWWARRDGCQDPAADKSTLNETGYQNVNYMCRGVVDIVRHYKILALNHTWPNTSLTVSPINASPIIIEFFREYHKPETVNTNYEGSQLTLAQLSGGEATQQF